jgi:hypothetical protein
VWSVEFFPAARRKYEKWEVTSAEPNTHPLFEPQLFHEELILPPGFDQPGDVQYWRSTSHALLNGFAEFYVDSRGKIIVDSLPMIANLALWNFELWETLVYEYLDSL